MRGAILVTLAERPGVPSRCFNTVMAAAFRLEDNAWRELRLTPVQPIPGPGQSLTDGEIEVIPPEYNNLQIGDIILQVRNP